MERGGREEGKEEGWEGEEQEFQRYGSVITCLYWYRPGYHMQSHFSPSSLKSWRVKSPNSINFTGEVENGVWPDIT